MIPIASADIAQLLLGLWPAALILALIWAFQVKQVGARTECPFCHHMIKNKFLADHMADLHGFESAEGKAEA